MIIDETHDDARQLSTDCAKMSDNSYFHLGLNVILHPNTLTRLSSLNLEVVAPMLIYDGHYSNFHASVDDSGYFKDGELYNKILRRKLKGIHQVPVVKECYLVRHDCVKYIVYSDGSERDEYVIFSDELRKQSIPQYVDTPIIMGLY
jgi:hypothetical protein